MQNTNALINETSPYLLQHVNNPVNWYPWSEEALNLAKQLDKPILLSIGYSACHWCHVMAHESFEDEKTAALMNDLFVNIKVDREERPDLDKIYQMAHQLLTQRHGGWPLTMFLTPEDQYPFFGGTYFPPEPRYGMPAFNDLLEKIAGFYHKNKAQITEQNSSLAQALQPKSAYDINTNINAQPLNAARDELAQQFDHHMGGFGGAPKFPHLSNIERLLHHYVMSRKQGDLDSDGLNMALKSLKKMALGGIYDHLGGGFCRYSVDDLWMIPHFEKMLYDNGPFLTIYSQAWQLDNQNLFKRVVLETATWVMREMQSPEGGFYSTLDADSEGEEGKFYTWTPKQVQELLGDDYPMFAYHFGLDKKANFEGKWHLHVYHERSELAKKYGLTIEQVDSSLETARQILFNERKKRIHPGRDEKILTSWNALMIKGMVTAGRIFEQTEYIAAAEKSLAFIKEKLWVNGRLLATYKDGKAHLNAYLDDYAFLLDAILTLLQARWNAEDMKFAISLAEVLLEEFEDENQGGFYFTGHQHETLITRSKSFADEAIPSGNAVAAVALGRLGHLLGETRYLQAAEKTIKTAWSYLSQMASVHSTMLLAVQDYLLPPEIIILRGEAEELKTWQQACQKDYAPQRLCFAIPNDAQELPANLAEKKPREIVAYICQGYQCGAPVTRFEELVDRL
jgi:uncharacterized protein YyaL (SSP411 family)